MKNSTTEENSKAGRFGVRFSVLLLAAAMLITTPAYSFAAPTDGTGSDKPAAAGTSSDEGAPSDGSAGENTDTASDGTENDGEPALIEQILSAGEEESYEITVAGKMPEDASLRVREIVKDPAVKNDEETEELPSYDELVESTVARIYEDDRYGDGDTLPYARFFDITIEYDGGKEYEPEEALSVKIDLKDDALKTKDVDFTAVHFDSDNNTELIPVEIQDKVAAFDAESFSVYGVVYSYTVDFYYTAPDAGKDAEPAEYHMNGGSEMKLSELFSKLGIDRETKDIKKVSFTDDSLLGIEKTGGDYRLSSLKPFKSSETLTVDFGSGDRVIIRVEDAAIVADGSLGTEGQVKWSLDDEGHLVIEPADGNQGNMGNAKYTSLNEKGVKRDKDCDLWPWEDYRDQIETAEIKGDIISWGTRKYIGMFEGCDNLRSADVSGLNVAKTADISYFFAYCPKLKTIKGLDKWGECEQEGGKYKGTAQLTNINSMFRGCESLESIDLSAWTSGGMMKLFANLCNGCTSLKSFKMNNKDLVTANESQWQNDYENQGVFHGCVSLETVDMSNITIRANSGKDHQESLTGLFMGLPSLKEVKMAGTDLSKVRSMENMFAGCENLETLTVTPKSRLDSIESMQDFVTNCVSLKTMDISGMDNSKLYDGYSEYHSGHELGFETLDSLETLKADNSYVCAAKNYSIIGKMEDIVAVRDIDFIPDAEFIFTPKGKYTWNNYVNGIHMQGDSYEGEQIAVTSRGVIQLIVNDDPENTDAYPNPNYKYPNAHAKGFLAPGTYVRTSEPTKTKIPQTYYVVDSMKGSVPVVEVKIGDDWKPITSVPKSDSGYVIHKSEYGDFIRVFTLGKKQSEWKDGTDAATDTYNYTEGKPIRITYPDAATSINGSKHDVIITVNSISFHDMSRIPNTTDTTYKNLKGPGPDDYEVINNPWGPDSNRPDKYKIPGYQDRNYDRYILNAEVGELRFWNQITNTSDHHEDVPSTYQHSKGSGTYIDFSMEIKGAQDGQSVLYWCDDLDMPENEYWQMPTANPNDDVKNGENYGAGAEGIILGEGNDLSTVTLAKKTLLQKLNYGEKTGNYIVGTAPDSDTVLSRFYVKSDATKANYTWTTGTACETSVLKDTSFKRPVNLDVRLDPQVGKTVNGKKPGSKLNNAFEFVMEPCTEIENVEVSGRNVPNKASVAYPDKKTVRNTGDKADFGDMTFIAPGARFIEVSGERDPVYNYYTVYKDSDNVKFSYKPDGSVFTWEVNREETEEGVIITYDEKPYTPCTDTVKAYVFRITEKKGTDSAITQYDETEHFLKVAVIAPQNDSDLEQGTRLQYTVGTRANGASEITWGTTGEITGKDTETAAAVIDAGTFNNKTSVYTLPEGSINVKKTLTGREWLNSDKFRMTLRPETGNEPMPDDAETTESGVVHADVLVTKADDQDPQDVRTYISKTGFGDITYSGHDMLDEHGVMQSSKTFTYDLEELEPQESGDAPIGGITYSEAQYEVDVTIKTDAEGKLDLDKVVTYPLDGEGRRGEPLQENIAGFTNKYDTNQTTEHLVAEKVFHSSLKDLRSGDYSFVLKPAGTYAAVAPMPKDSTGTEADRTLTVKNIVSRIEFDSASDEEDGLTFRYKDKDGKEGLCTTLKPYFDNDPTKVDAALHSEKGVEFEYEMYEVIPDGAVNNDDGTYSVYDSATKTMTVYDGIHHMRKVVVRVVTSTDPDHPDEEELDIEARPADHDRDYYLKSDGTKVVLEDGVDGYDAKKHHMGADGAPVFHNEYLPENGSVKVNKIWQDFGDKSARSEVEFTLYRQKSGEDRPVQVLEDAGGDSVVPQKLRTLKDGSVAWKKLPVYDENGEKIRYSVKESGAAEPYVTTVVPDEVTLTKDEVSSVTVRNIRVRDAVTRTVTRTIRYVDNKGNKLYENNTTKATFTAVPVIRRKPGTDEPYVTKDGELIVDWVDEDGTVLGVDNGDGSDIKWDRSTVRKTLKEVVSPKRNHYSCNKTAVPEDKVKATDKDYEETVVYTPDNYKVHFDANGGSGIMFPQSMTWDEKSALNANKFHRNGYIFTGWNTKADGTGIALTDKQAVENFINADGSEITLYAQWVADPNGGGSHRGSGTNTGDSNALIPLTCMTGVCLAALIALIAMRRRRRG